MRSAREAILLPHQLKRLSELGWQYQAVRESTRAFVACLGLTADEARQLLAIENEQGGKLHEELWEFHHRAQREFLEILTPEQRVEWARKTGEEFIFAPRAPGLLLLIWLR